MAQVDAFRFLANVAKLFAPAIVDGQQFVAYIGEDNEFHIQADNIIRASAAETHLDTAQIDALSERISALQTQADDIQNICSHIPALLTQIQTLSGSTDGQGQIDFEFAFLSDEIYNLRADFYKLNEKLNQLS